jgi:hypothetical protein
MERKNKLTVERAKPLKIITSVLVQFLNYKYDNNNVYF